MQSAAAAAGVALALVRHAERTWQLSLDQTLTNATNNKHRSLLLLFGDQHQSFQTQFNDPNKKTSRWVLLFGCLFVFFGGWIDDR